MPRVHQQRPGQLPDPRPQRGQSLLAVPPRRGFVVPEPGPHPVPEPPGVAAVVTPARQPGAQLLVIGWLRPVPQLLSQLTRRVDDEPVVGGAAHPVHPSLAVAPVPDAGRAEPRPDRQRGHRVPRLVPRRLHRRRPRGRVASRGATVISLPDPDLVHDRLVVVPDQPAQLGLDLCHDPRGGGRQSSSTRHPASLPSLRAASKQYARGPAPQRAAISYRRGCRVSHAQNVRRGGRASTCPLPTRPETSIRSTSGTS